MVEKLKNVYISVHVCINDPRVSVNLYLTPVGKIFYARIWVKSKEFHSNQFWQQYWNTVYNMIANLNFLFWVRELTSPDRWRITLFWQLALISQLYLHCINCYTMIWEIKIIFLNVLLLCLYVKNFTSIILYHLWIS